MIDCPQSIWNWSDSEVVVPNKRFSWLRRLEYYNKPMLGIWSTDFSNIRAEYVYKLLYVRNLHLKYILHYLIMSVNLARLQLEIEHSALTSICEGRLLILGLSICVFILLKIFSSLLNTIISAVLWFDAVLILFFQSDVYFLCYNLDSHWVCTILTLGHFQF